MFLDLNIFPIALLAVGQDVYHGATTLSIMTLSITTLSITTLIITTLSIMTFSIIANKM